MTGRELCELIGIDYDKLRLSRQIDQSENRHYFFSELIAIREIREEIIHLISQSVDSSE